MTAVVSELTAFFSWFAGSTRPYLWLNVYMAKTLSHSQLFLKICECT